MKQRIREENLRTGEVQYYYSGKVTKGFLELVDSFDALVKFIPKNYQRVTYRGKLYSREG